MKNLKLLLASGVLCLFMTTSAFSLTISGGIFNGTDVGSVDTFITWDDMGTNSNPTTETNWVNSILAPETVTYTVKFGDDIPIYSTNDTGVYAVAMPAPDPSNTDYFLVKNSTYVALYANLVELDWGVFAAGDLPPEMNIPGGFTVSHVTLFDSEGGGGGGGDPIPEPASFMLFGIGLLGLARISRRKK